MDPITAIDLQRIFFGDQNIIFLIELMFRVLVVYSFALIFLRAGGKRARKQMTPVEMLLIVALGTGVGDAMLFSDVPLLYAGMVIVTVIVLQYAMARLKLSSNFVEKFVNSRANMLMKHGQILDEALNVESYTRQELYSELRANGVRNTGEVEYVFLELGGELSVFKFDKENVLPGENIVPVPEKDGFMKV